MLATHAKKDTADSVAQDAGTGDGRSRRDITRDLKRLQDEKEAAVNKRAQVSGRVCFRDQGRSGMPAPPITLMTVRERTAAVSRALTIRSPASVDGVAPPRHRAGTVTCDVHRPKNQGRGPPAGERHDFPESGGVCCLTWSSSSPKKDV